MAAGSPPSNSMDNMRGAHSPKQVQPNQAKPSTTWVCRKGTNILPRGARQADAILSRTCAKAAPMLAQALEKSE